MSNGGSLAPRPSRGWLAPLKDRWVFAVVAAALVVAGLAPVLYWGGNLDAAWYLYVAHRVLAGAHLYRDIVEINPPLIIALSIPLELLARALGVVDLVVYNVATAALAVVSVAFCGRWLRRLFGDESDGVRRALLLLLLAALFPLAVADFGQREHLLLVLVLPYLCLTAARLQGAAMPRVEAIAAGAMAGVGLSLKPFFLPLWVALEGYLMLVRRSGPPWKRAETLAIGGIGALYLLAVVVFTPGYFALVGWLGPVYASLLRQPLVRIVANSEGVLPLIAAAAIGVTPGVGAWRSLRAVLLVAVTTSLVAVLLQQKGWSYHYYPARAESFVAFGVVLLCVAPLGLGRAKAKVAALASLLLAADLALVLVQRGREAVAGGQFERYVVRDLMVPLVQRHAAGRAILGLTVSPTPSFPLVNFSGAEWALRFPSLWMLPALNSSGRWAWQRAGAPPVARSPEQQYLINAVTNDLVDRRPALIVFYAPAPGAPDLVGYLASADSRFAEALHHYRLLDDIAGYRFLVLGTEETP